MNWLREEAVMGPHAIPIGAIPTIDLTWRLKKFLSVANSPSEIVPFGNF